jgi:hypothetical protein
VLFEQALALFGRLGDKRGIAIATGYLGHLAALRGDDEKASKLLTESLASPRDLDDLPLAENTPADSGRLAVAPLDRSTGRRLPGYARH